MGSSRSNQRSSRKARWSGSNASSRVGGRGRRTRPRGWYEKKHFQVTIVGVVISATATAAAILETIRPNPSTDPPSARELRGGPPSEEGFTVEVGSVTASSYVIPVAEGELPRAPRAKNCDGARRREWLEELNPVPVDRVEMPITVAAPSDQTLFVRDVRLKRHPVSQPVGVNLALCPHPPPGAEYVRRVSLNLEASRGDVLYRNRQDRPVGRFEFNVGPKDPETLYLEAFTSLSAVRWTAEVVVEGEAGRVTGVIDDGGRPFLITARAPGPVLVPDCEGDLRPAQEVSGRCP